MRLAMLFLALLGLLAQGKGKDCPHRKAATLLPSFTVTSTASSTTSQRPTTTSQGNSTAHTTSNTTATSPGPTTATQNPATTTSHGNATVYPTTSNGTATSPGFSTIAPHPGPPPPSPSPSPGSKGAVGNYTWTNASQPCAQLQAQIQIRILYPTQGGGKDLEQSQSVVYLNYLAVEYNVSFPQATQWTFLAQNSSLRDLQAPLGQSFSCRNSSIVLSPAIHLDLLSLRLQASQLPHTGVFGPSFSCTNDQSFWLPLIIGLVLLGLLTLVLIAFCIARRRQSAYQPL
ncbi:macrosialin isoform X2 [Nannospalax galili]|uniref:macrosialin isoform X2 n=1 Tax=Nannospalax galili TaxID=1026970 RepID=UPI000819D942|nr:macrosialin isoform X2 [Nannospalax galili]